MNKNTTIYINNETSNPIAVEVLLNAEKENGSWNWSIEHVESVELVIGDKEGINITSKIRENKRAMALLISQVADQDDQIIDALEESICKKAS
jgi:hypothetical protein